MEVKDITQEEFNSVKSTRTGKWNISELKSLVKELKETERMQVSIEINDFYKNFYNGNKEIKYKSYYCRKHLIEAFTEQNINAEVKTSDGFLFVKIAGEED